MPAAYGSFVWDRWGFLAFCARYGHQSVRDMIGRVPTELELRVFARRLVMLVENERPEVPGAGGGED